MNASLRVLCLEDDPDFAELVKSMLEAEGLPTEMLVVDNCADFAVGLERGNFDVILSDYQLPTGNGLQALHAARQKSPDTPFVLISGCISEQAAIATLSSGATDYILKNGINRLVPAVRRAVNEAQERKRAADELKKSQAKLADASRLAGTAEVATSVLHNVGNVINSVNVSVSLISDELKKSRIENLGRIAAMMQEHAADIGDFISRDPKGKQVPEYLCQLAEHMDHEQAALLKEMDAIRSNIEHVKEIVATQQSYSQVGGATERVRVSDLVEDALRMNAGALTRHDAKVIRQYEENLPEITVDKNKVLQILVNLIGNAKYACDESSEQEKRLTLAVRKGDNRVQISVADNGVGIPPENMDKIFNHGFTTRKNGHGFGLHSSLAAARQLGGTLSAQSDGPGKGATFTLDLPLASRTN
jgi:C4-dicarboxylate-specific signal transduction histidine kinase